jgi:two-component system chemotaxis response regulator CheY
MALNILVVDDSATVRAVIAKTFEVACIDVGELHQAENGKEALDILADNWIDIVFADINMPVMGGVEMVEKMNEGGLLKTIPVVIVSTEGSATRIEQLKAKGVSAYIRKPFAPEIIRKVVDDIVGVQDGNES